MGKAVQKEVAGGSASPSGAKTGHVADLGQTTGWDSRLRGHQDRDQPPEHSSERASAGHHHQAVNRVTPQPWGWPSGTAVVQESAWRCEAHMGSPWAMPGPSCSLCGQHSNTRHQEWGPSQTRGCWATAEMQPTCPTCVMFGPSPAMTSLAPASHHHSRVQSEHTPEVCSHVGTLGTEPTAVAAAPRARCPHRADMEHPGCGASRLPVGLSPCPKEWQRIEFRHGLL